MISVPIIAVMIVNHPLTGRNNALRRHIARKSGTKKVGRKTRNAQTGTLLKYANK